MANHTVIKVKLSKKQHAHFADVRENLLQTALLVANYVGPIKGLCLHSVSENK